MSPGTGSRIVIVALAIPLLAGCLSFGSSPTGPAAEEPPAWKKPLSYYGTCRPNRTVAWLGQGFPCNGTATRVTWRASPPPGWVCYIGSGGDDAWYRNASSTEEQWGYWYDLGPEPPNRGSALGGVAMVETDGERRLYHWPVQDSLRGFVAFPPDPWGQTATVNSYVYATETIINRSQPQADRLANGTLSQGWSLVPKNASEGIPFYLVQNLDTPAGTYHFRAGPHSYESFWHGTDFDLVLQIYPHISGPSDTWITEAPSPPPFRGGCPDQGV